MESFKRSQLIGFVFLTGCSLVGTAKSHDPRGHGTSSSSSESSSADSEAGDDIHGQPAPEAAAAPGAWCKGYKSEGDSHAKWVDDYIKSEGWSARVRSYIAMSACDKPGDDARARKIAGWRDQYNATFGTTARDFNDMCTEYMIGAPAARDKEAAFTAKAKKMSRIQGAALRSILDPHNMSYGDLIVAGDRATPTQMERVAMVLQCIPERIAEGDAYGVRCIPDLEGLERKPFNEEIAAFDRFEKVMLREGFGTARVRVEQWKKISAERAGDKVWKAIVVDAPAAAMAKWDELYRKNQTVLDAAHDINAKLLDDPDSVKGCSTDMLASFKKFFAKNKPKDRDEAWSLLHNAVGAPLSIALRGCQAVDGNILAATSFETIIRYRPQGPSKGKGKDEPKDDSKSTGRLLIGPRTAGYWGAVDALGEAISNNKKLPFRTGQIGSLPDVGRVDYDPNKISFSTSPTSRNGRFGHYGTIKSTKPMKGGLLVEFKRERATFYEQECVSGSTPIGINSDGSLDYGYYCKPSNRTYTEDVTEEKVWIPKQLTDGIKPGNTLVFYTDTKASPQVAFPIELYQDKKMKKLIGYMGTTF